MPVSNVRFEGVADAVLATERQRLASTCPTLAETSALLDLDRAVRAAIVPMLVADFFD